MDTHDNINNLKMALNFCKERLDHAYSIKNYFSVSEEADKMSKLSYTISFLEMNCKI